MRFVEIASIVGSSCAWARARGRHTLFLGLTLLLPAHAARAAGTADEIHWTILGETAVTFDWRGTADSIFYGLTPDYDHGVRASAPPPPLPFSSAGPFWEARLTGLSPDTRYHYSIGRGPDHTFKTPVRRGSSGFTVCAEGDIGTGTRMGEVQAIISAERPDFVLALGDLTYGNSHGQDAVDLHFNEVMVWSQDAAYMPCWGNHEFEPGDDLRNYKGRFDFPNPRTSPGSPSVSCCGEDWYWFDYGNVRFIAYPEPYPGAWADWFPRADAIMDSAQADPAITFIVTFGHRPAYSSGHYDGNTTLKGYLDALGASHSKYVLNLNGHDHSYQRSKPQSGVVHITAGGGGRSLYPFENSAPGWVAYRAVHHGALRLRFTASAIQGAMICGPSASNNDVSCAPGSVLDGFVIGTPAPPGNQPPGVDAGPDRTVMLPSDALLDGTVIDDGLPEPASVSLAWTSNGPGDVEFENAHSADTRARFSVAGTYALVLTASDGELAGRDTTQVVVESEGTGIHATLERRVSASSDDAEERQNGSVSTTSPDLEMMTDGTPQRAVGIRFANLAIPRAAQIEAAWIQFTAMDAESSTATSLGVALEASDDAASFTTATSSISTRPATAEVAWSAIGTWAGGEAESNQRTPDLSALIHSVVSRPGWESGNALAVIVTGSGLRRARSYDSGALDAPLLHVEYRTALPTSGVELDRGSSLTLASAPNPASRQTSLRFTIPFASAATLTIHDLQGRVVRRLINGTLSAGLHEATWDGLDRKGNPAPQGMYLSKLITSAGEASQKIIWLP